MKKISPLGWVGIAAAAYVLFLMPIHVSQQVPLTPEEQQAQQDAFQQQSDKAKQDILDQMNQNQ